MFIYGFFYDDVLVTLHVYYVFYHLKLSPDSILSLYIVTIKRLRIIFTRLWSNAVHHRPKVVKSWQKTHRGRSPDWCSRRIMKSLLIGWNIWNWKRTQKMIYLSRISDFFHNRIRNSNKILKFRNTNDFKSVR